MNILMTIIYFLIAIGILVIVHEFGHFLTARLSGMRTEVFAFGMGNRLFGWNKLLGFRFGKLPEDYDGGDYCDYRVAAFPIGGYVKISGMIDESMDKNYQETAPQPWEFRSKNVFQKIITISGGVIFNLILAYLIFTTIIQIQGKDYWATTKIGSVAPGSIASEIGLMPGDDVISVNGQKIRTWDHLAVAISLEEMGKDKNILILRNGEKLNLKVNGSKVVKDMVNKKYFGIAPFYLKTILISINQGTPADRLGLKAGDTIIAINGNPVITSSQFQKTISRSKNKTVSLTWKRDNEFMTSNITPTKDGIIGVGISEAYTGPKIHENFDLFTAMNEGAKDTYQSINVIISSFGQMINGNVSFKQSVGGPIAIAKMASQQAQHGLVSFLNFVAMMSLMLAIVNILPLPALDGGHLVIIIIEGIFRRELPVKIKMGIQQVGMVLLLGFMAFVIYLDLTR